MNSVDPIRNKDDVSNLLKYLKNKKERDYIMALTVYIADIVYLIFYGLKYKTLGGKIISISGR